MATRQQPAGSFYLARITMDAKCFVRKGPQLRVVRVQVPTGGLKVETVKNQ